jgi:hypothetical protein
MIKLIKRWIDKWKHKRKMKKRIEQLKKNDPFIYKH